jgi:signal transduction histidine kinase
MTTDTTTPETAQMNKVTPARSRPYRRLAAATLGAALVAAIAGFYVVSTLLVGVAGMVAMMHVIEVGRAQVLHALDVVWNAADADEIGEMHPYLAPVHDRVVGLIHNAAASKAELKEAIQQERMKTLELEMLANRLEEAGRQLEQVNEELEAFTYSASHDLATPLKVIESLSQIVSEDYAERLDETGRKHLAAINGSAGRLIALVQDLLVLSRLKAPDPADAKEVRLADLVQGLVADLKPGLPERARFQIAGDLPTVEAPPERVRQVLQNLITNGCKFNRSAEPTITIDGWTEGGIGIIRITDNGIGIPEHAEDDAFGLFKRLHGNDEFAGTGAGLAIARRSARSLGGELWIERSSPAGTTFALALPTRQSNWSPGFTLNPRSSKYLLD